MTDSQILDRVYEMLKASVEKGIDTEHMVKEQIQFIEEEWQTADYLARIKENGGAIGVQGPRGETSTNEPF